MREVMVDGTMQDIFTVSWKNPPNGGRGFAGIVLVGELLTVPEWGRHDLTGPIPAPQEICEVKVPAPTQLLQMRIWLVSYNKEGKRNSILPGITPFVTVLLGRDGGTIDPGQLMRERLAAHFEVKSGVLGVAPEGITAEEVAKQAIGNPHIDRLTVNKLAVVDSDIVNCSVNKITGREGWFQELFAAAFEAVSGFFQEVGIGGSDLSHALIKASASGVTIDPRVKVQLGQIEGWDGGTINLTSSLTFTGWGATISIGLYGINAGPSGVNAGSYSLNGKSGGLAIDGSSGRTVASFDEGYFTYLWLDGEAVATRNYADSQIIDESNAIKAWVTANFVHK